MRFYRTGAYIHLCGDLLVTHGLFFMQTKKFAPGQGNFSLSAIFALVIPILLIVAMRGIRKDEKLVKSLDRLR